MQCMRVWQCESERSTVFTLLVDGGRREMKMQMDLMMQSVVSRMRIDRDAVLLFFVGKFDVHTYRTH